MIVFIVRRVGPFAFGLSLIVKRGSAPACQDISGVGRAKQRFALPEAPSRRFTEARTSSNCLHISVHVLGLDFN